MSKNKRKEKRAKQIRENFTLQSFESLFRDMTENELNQSLIDIGKDSNEKFQQVINEFQNLIIDTNPIMLLSFFALYGLTYSGVTLESDKPIKISQHHVELMQAFILQKNPAEFTFNPHFNSPIFLDFLDNLSHYFQSMRFQDLGRAKDINEKYKQSQLQAMRLNTQLIRNWGYPSQVKRLTIQLFRPLDNDVEKILNIKTEYLINMLFNTIKLIEQRINQHVQKIKQILKMKDVTNTIIQYTSIFMESKGQTELLELVKSQKISLLEVRYFLLEHNKLFLDDLFILDLDDFSNAYGETIENDDLIKILDTWSLSFGDLSESNSEHFFMGNPIWYKPLIKLDSDKFFLPICGLFVSFGIELVEKIIKSNNALWQKYERRRGEFLELAVYDLFQNNFINAKIYRGSQWYEGNQIYENDLLVLFDTTAIVIEAKSGKLRPNARRGSDIALKDDIEKLIIDASIQANRFVDFLRANPRYEFKTRSGQINDVDASNIKFFQCISVTIDSLGVLGTHLAGLKDAGFIENNINIIPTISLPDMEIIFELLENPSQILHYLQWRNRLEQSYNFSADESDLLATYVNDKFLDIFVPEPALIYGVGETLNPYLMRAEHNQSVLKPTRKFTKWWRDILNRVEQRAIIGWTELAKMLLELPYNEQKKMDKLLRNSCNQLRKKTTDICHIASLSHSSLSKSIILLVYRDMPTDERNLFVKNLAEENMINNNTNTAFVIGLDINREKEDYPYTFLLLLNLDDFK